MAMQETYTLNADNLFAGTQVQPVVADEVIVASGAGVLVRGTALGLDADGKYNIVDSGGDVTAVVAILAETVDATSEDRPAPAYFTGEFNKNSIVFGGTDTADDHIDAARARGIFFKDAVKA